MPVAQGIDVSWCGILMVFTLQDAADIDEAALAGIEKVELAVVGDAPNVALPVRLARDYAVRGEGMRIAAICCEGISVITAEAVPRRKPHQAVRGLLHAGNEVGGQAVTYAERAHIDVGLGVAQQEYA